MSRRKQQLELIFNLGHLFRPLMDVVEGNSQDDPRQVRARFLSDLPKYVHDYHVFAEGEPLHSYIAEVEGFNRKIDEIFNFLRRDFPAKPLTKEMITQWQHDLSAIVHEIPTSADIGNYLAITPFSTYRALQGICEVAQKRILWADNYPGETIFGHYLERIPATCKITLVVRDMSDRGRDDVRRYGDFLHVARNFSIERGPNAFELRTKQNIHDRHIFVDDTVYHVGNSIKDLGGKTPCSISLLPDLNGSNAALEAELMKSIEIYGPNHPQSPDDKKAKDEIF